MSQDAMISDDRRADKTNVNRGEKQKQKKLKCTPVNHIPVTCTSADAEEFKHGNWNM